jgi:hypothetical protein
MKRTSHLIELTTVLGLGLATCTAAGLTTKTTGKAATGLPTSADERRGGDDPRLGPDSQSGASDFLVKGGTWLVLTGNVKLSIGGNFLNRGTLAPAIGPTVIFGGRSAQAETGFAVFPNLMKTGGGTLTLNNTVAISGTLILDNGNISLNGNNLEALSITGGSAASYIVTPDTSGGLIRPVGPTSSTLFPVGNSSFNPVSVRTGTGTDLFRVSVVDSLMPTAPDKQNALKRTWLIFQSNPPGANGNIVFSVQWNAGEEGSQFDRSLGGAGSADGWRWGGTSWVKQTNSRFHDNGLGIYPAIDSLMTQNLGLWTLANENGALPIQLVSFTASLVNGHRVQLDWTTASEVNNFGFEVQRRGGSDSTFMSLPNLFIPGHGTTNEQHSYSAVDSTSPPDLVFYRLKQLDLNGTSYYSDPVSIQVPTSVNQANVPTEFILEQNYPNPFNPTTTIKFSLPREGQVDLSIFNILGEQVATVVNGRMSTGYYSYQVDASKLASGIYFYRITAPDFVDTKRMMLVK